MVESQYKVYLVNFRLHRQHLDFALQELESLAELFNVDREQLYLHDVTGKNLEADPTVWVRLPNDTICKEILKRAIMIKEIIDVFSTYVQPSESVLKQEPKSDPELWNLRWQGLIENVEKEKLLPLLDKGIRFKFMIDGVGRKVSMAEQLHIIEMFKKFPFVDDDVSLNNPQIIYKIVENTVDGRVYCGKVVAAQRVSEHSGKDKNDDTFFAKYNLKKRPYLGPTSTDHELALLMANQGHCKEGDLVYDPFVGTGSIAVACQHFGACVIGSDIDMRVLKGYGVGRKTTNKGIEGLDKIEKFDIHTNFKYYRMPVPDFMAMDISALGFNMIKNGFKPRRPIFDAIVCDPPYGVRARSQKIGVRESRKDKTEAKRESRDEEEPYFAQKDHFDFVELHDHLLEIASTLLVLGGRLVFLFHTDEASQENEKARFPIHPSFRLLRSSRDKLTLNRARHLITMVKI